MIPGEAMPPPLLYMPLHGKVCVAVGLYAASMAVLLSSVVEFVPDVANTEGMFKVTKLPIFAIERMVAVLVDPLPFHVNVVDFVAFCALPCQIYGAEIETNLVPS